jgi:hypothetical protein
MFFLALYAVCPPRILFHVRGKMFFLALYAVCLPRIFIPCEGEKFHFFVYGLPTSHLKQAGWKSRSRALQKKTFHLCPLKKGETKNWVLLPKGSKYGNANATGQRRLIYRRFKLAHPKIYNGPKMP